MIIFFFWKKYIYHKNLQTWEKLKRIEEHTHKKKKNKQKEQVTRGDFTFMTGIFLLTPQIIVCLWSPRLERLLADFFFFPLVLLCPWAAPIVTKSYGTWHNFPLEDNVNINTKVYRRNNEAKKRLKRLLRHLLLEHHHKIKQLSNKEHVNNSQARNHRLAGWRVRSGNLRLYAYQR